GFGPVSPTMDEIIAKAMARDREERFDSAMAMFEALEQREREMTSEKPGQRDTWFPGQEIAGTRATMDGGAGGEAVSTGGDRPAGGASRPAAGGGGTSSGGPASPPGSDRSGRSPEMSDTVAMEKPPSPVADGAEDPAVDWNDEGEAQHAGDTRDRGPEPNAGGSSAPSGPSTRSEPSTGSGSHDNRASARSDEQASRPPADDAQNKPSLDDDPPNETLVVGTIIAGSIVVGVLLALAVFYFFG
ncbi:MAG: hypothetical protein ABEL76_02715, partial [Bradymonadaceae bacterium]